MQLFQFFFVLKATEQQQNNNKQMPQKNKLIQKSSNHANFGSIKKFPIRPKRFLELYIQYDGVLVLLLFLYANILWFTNSSVCVFCFFYCNSLKISVMIDSYQSFVYIRHNIWQKTRYKSIPKSPIDSMAIFNVDFKIPTQTTQHYVRFPNCSIVNSRYVIILVIMIWPCWKGIFLKW